LRDLHKYTSHNALDQDCLVFSSDIFAIHHVVYHGRATTELGGFHGLGPTVRPALLRLAGRDE
jgi:hypothetical protein